MSTRMIKQLLMSSQYFVLNKQIVIKLGIEPAFLLSVLAEADNQLADENGWFFQTAETIQHFTGLSNHKQTKSIEKLIKLGILQQQNRGVPCKRYFKINYETLQEFVFNPSNSQFSKNLKTGFQKNEKLDSENFKNKNSKNSKTIYKEINNKEINKEINNNTVVDNFSAVEKKEVIPSAVRQEIEMAIRSNNWNIKVQKLLMLAEGDYMLVLQQIKHFGEKGLRYTIAAIKGKYEVNQEPVKTAEDEKKERFKEWEHSIQLIEHQYKNCKEKIKPEIYEWMGEFLKERGII